MSNSNQSVKGANRTTPTRPLFKPLDVPKLMSASKLVELELPRGKHHWGPRIRSGQLGMLHAPRGSGKTFGCLALAIANATGCTWLGLRAKKPRRVVYCDGEMDIKTIASRIKKISASLGVDVPERLQVFSPEMFSDLLPSINTTEGQRVIDNMIGEDFDVLFIDNYSAFNDSGSETAEAWAPVMRWLLRHKRAGRTVIVVHHTGKVGNKQRGTSKHEDAMDWVISLTPVPIREPGSRDLRFTLEWKKIRHLAAVDVPPITVTMHSSEAGDLSWSHVAGKPTDQIDRQIRKLHQEGKNNAEIARSVGLNRSTVSRRMKEIAARAA